MSVSTQKRQVKEEHLKEGLITLCKNKLDFFFKNIATPGLVPENIAICSSYLAISLIFVLDVMTDPAISFQLLYIFPLIFIALHSSRTGLVVGVVTLSISLQYVSPIFFQGHTLELPICPFFLIVFSNITCVLFARYSRAHILEIKRLSTIDSLTQLCNRRGFDMAMETEAVQHRRKGECGNHFSLVALDLDGFKGLNDSKGHKAGDEVLILLGCVLRSLIRQTDMIFRVGGDEFVVLMPNTEAADCHALCNLLCHTICLRLTEAFSHPLSASIGFTTSENSNEISVNMLIVADKALYRAKALGKNCVVRGYAEEFS